MSRVRVRKDPKGKALPTREHRVKTAYRRSKLKLREAYDAE